MADYKAGTAWLEIIPSFKGIEGAIGAEVEKIGRQVDATLAKTIPEGMQKSLREASKVSAKEMEKAGEEGGLKYAGAFAKNVRARFGPASGDIPKIKIDADTSPFDREMMKVRNSLQRTDKFYVRGKISDDTLLGLLDKNRDRLHNLMATAPDPSGFRNARSSLSELEQFHSMVAGDRRAGFGGGLHGGAFNDTMHGQLQQTLGVLPKGESDANTTDAQVQLLAVRNMIASLSRQRIGIDIDEQFAIEKIQFLKARLDELAKHPTELQVRADAAAASKGLDNILKMATAKADDAGAEAGDRFGGRFADRFGQHIGKAVGALPNIQGDLAGVTDGQLSLKTLRDQLDELGQKTIGVNIDEGMAIAHIEDIKRRLDELARDDPSVRVRVEAAAAAAELTEILVLAGRIDKSDPKVKVKVEGKKEADDTESALTRMADAAGIGGSRLMMLVSIGIALGTVVVPAAAAAAVAVSGLAQAAAAAGSGVGVFALGISGISGAVQALNQMENDQAKSAASLSNSHERVAGALDAVESAERSLANTRENVADAAKRSAQAVVDAQRGVIDSERQAEAAVKDLQKAYDDARKAEEDRVLALRSNSLAQRQAAIDLADAKKKLDLLMANPRATELEREAARITYAQRALHIDELAVKQQRLQEDAAKADKAGIEGSTQVVAAKEKVRAANENIGKAEQRLADSIDAQQKQQRQGAFQLVQATQAVTNAQRQLEKAATTAGVAGGAALANLDWAMQQLGPAGERFARFIYGLKGQFLGLREAAQSAMLPGLQMAIEGLMAYMPQIKTFVGQVAAALGGIFMDVVVQLKDPTWQRFFSFIADTAVPTLQGMYKFTADVAKGIADVIMALSPLNSQMGGGLLNMAEGFAHWAQTLNQSAGYYKFLDYVSRVGPKVVEFFGELATMLGHIVVAAAPMGEQVLNILIGIVKWINSLPMGTLTTFVSILASFYAAMLGISVAAKVFGVAGAIFEGVGKTQAGVWGGLKKVADEYQATLKGTTTETQNAGKGHDFMASRLAALTPALQSTAESTNVMSRGMAAATVVGKGLHAGFSSLLGLFGGPLGIALTGFSYWLTTVGIDAAETKSRIEGVRGSLVGLAEAYGRGGNSVNQYVMGQMKSDENFRRLIQNSDKLGISVGTVTEAVHGNKGALDQINGTYDQQISQLTTARDLLHSSAEAQNQLPEETAKAQKLDAEIRKKFGVSIDDHIKHLAEEKTSVNGAAVDYKELRVALGLASESVDRMGLKAESTRSVLVGGKKSVEDFTTAIAEFGDISATEASRAGALAAISDRIADSQFKASDKMTLFRGVLQQLGTATSADSPTFDALAGVFDNIARSAGTAGEKTGLLKQAMDQMYGAARAQVEADDRMAQTQADLQLRLQDSSLGFDLKAASTAADTQAIVGNRHSLEAALIAVNDKYVADVAAAQQTGNVDEALQKARVSHDQQTEAIRQQIDPAHRDSAAVNEIVKAVGSIPPEKHTDIKVNGEVAMRELVKGFALQKGLSENWTKERTQQFMYVMLDEWFGPKIGNTPGLGRAEGGIIPGQSPHKKADNIRAWLTAGEYVHPVDSVDYYGVPAMEAIRKRVIPRELLDPSMLRAFGALVQPSVKTPGDGSQGIAFANGGLVNNPTGGPIWPFPIRMDVKMPVDVAELQRRMDQGIYWSGEIPGNVAGVQDWIRTQAGKPYGWAEAGPVAFDCSGLISAVWNLLHGLAPYAHTFSTMNEGDYFPQPGNGLFTAAWTNPGESGVGGGPDGVGHTAANLAGLLFESRGGDGVVVGPRVTGLNRFAHLGHYDSGGKLPEGLGTYLNTTGRPENVLTDGQWNAVFDLAQRPAESGQGNTYQFHMRDTDLTAGRLRALQAEDAVRAREGRAR